MHIEDNIFIENSNKKDHVFWLSVAILLQEIFKEYIKSKDSSLCIFFLF